MKENKLPKRTTLLWQVRIMCVTLILVVGCLYFKSLFSPLIIIAIAIGALGLFAAFIYLPFYFKSYRIYLSEEAVIVKFGILIKFEHIMPYKRMIYAQSIATPLAKKLGLASVRLKAARSYLFVVETEEESVKAIMDFLAEGESHE